MNTYICLLHSECLDKNGKEITTAITNLDLHDLSRLCLTYGVNRLYIVHPIQDQRAFAQRLVDHWVLGAGGEYNPLRKRALELISLVKDMDEVKRETKAYMIGTTARQRDGSLSFDEVREISMNRDICLVFGTGWGFAPQGFSCMDAIAGPIQGGGEFNHLSVRSAASIAIDRVLGR
ncbi:MAG: RNA methyltransferase [Thermodesulfobacteriota bacterium]|nr:RNA methyltransferase [Thermodesulfobacteriota bacterium]